MKPNKIKINKIKENRSNPRFIGKDKFKKLVKSLKEFPEMLKLRPIVVDNNNIILGGNMRYKAAVELGMKEIWVIQADDLSEKQKQEFIIKDNVGFGEWDWDILANDWDVKKLEDWGLVGFPFEEDITEVKEDDYTEPDEIQVDVVLGDLIEIGNHRLLCGDCTKESDVKKLMNGQKADMVFTDPPYGISIVQSNKVGGDKTFGSVGGDKIVKSKNYSKVIGDETTDTARNFYNTCISLGMENFIIWGGNYFTDFLAPSMCWIVWDKQNTGNFADVELAWTSFNKAAKLYQWQWNGMIRKGDKKIEGKSRVHPTQKPVGLFGEIFNDFDFKSCFDGFLGSGSTMVASQQLNRVCYGMELDPKYCQIVIDRMYKFNSSLIIKINGKRYTPNVNG